MKNANLPFCLITRFSEALPRRRLTTFKGFWFDKECKTAVFLDYDVPLSSFAQAFTDGIAVHSQMYNLAI
jgi:hypothetical protein